MAHLRLKVNIQSKKTENIQNKRDSLRLKTAGQMLTMIDTGTACPAFPLEPSTDTQLQCSNKQELLVSSASKAIQPVQ